MAYTNYIYYGALGLAILSSASLVVLIIAHASSENKPENDVYRVELMKSFIKAICLFLIVAGVWR